MRRIGILLALTLLLPGGASAAVWPYSHVSFEPRAPREGDSIELLTTYRDCDDLEAPSVVRVVGNEIHVHAFIRLQPCLIPSRFYSQRSIVGQLPAGDYRVVHTETRYYRFGGPTTHGPFLSTLSVQPVRTVPAGSLLAALTLAAGVLGVARSRMRAMVRANA